MSEVTKVLASLVCEGDTCVYEKKKKGKVGGDTLEKELLLQ